MGMSASQARLLSLTSRMHDLEFEAQALQYSKLDLANIKSAAYDNYIEALDSTKIQMTMLTPEGNEYQDVTYRNLISQTTGATHSMYVVKDLNDRIILPEQIASHVIFEDLASYNGTQDQFLGIVGRFYLYAGRPDIDTMSDGDIIQEMRKDGNFNYWASIFSQIVNSKGIVPITSANASDRNWLNDALMSGDVQLYKMTNETQMSDGVSVNIFAKTSVALDPELVEVKNDELIALAEVEYEKAIDDVDAKETKLDLKLAQIDTQHNALKTEYDSIKQIVSKNIERSYKTFNA